MKLKLSFAALVLVLTGTARGQQLINCITSPPTPCSATQEIGNGTQGDKSWLAFGKFNADITFLYANLPTLPISVANGGNGTGTPALTAGTNVTITGTWPNYTISATGSGSGTVNSGTSGYVAYYPATGTAVSGLATTGTGNVVLATAPTITLPNATGLPIATGVSGLGTGIATALSVNVGSAGSPVINGGALGTPSSGTLANATGLPIATGVSGLGSGIATFLATPSSANLASAVTGETGSGALVFGTNPAISSASITTATIDNTTVADALLFTDLQASQLVGTIPAASIPGSSVRYPNAASVTILSSDNGNVVNNDYAGASSVTLPAINTSGITPNAFQVAIFNSNTGTMTITPVSPTTINLGTSLSVPSGTGVIIFADANGSGTGNYNYTAFPAGSGSTGAGLGANTFTGIQELSFAAPAEYFADTAQSGTNITDWGIRLVSGTNGQMCLHAYADGFTGGTDGLCLTRGASGSTTGQGVPTVTIGASASGTATSFPGSGTNTFAGTVKAPLFVINGSSLCSTTNQSCIYQPASNQIGFGGVPSGTATEYAYFNAAGNLVHLFDSYIQETSPREIWQDTSQSSSTNLEVSQLTYASDVLTLGSLTDTFTAGYSAFSATRGASGSTTGPQWVSETFGCTACATTFSFLGGNATFAAQVKAADVVVNGSALGATGTAGIYNPASTQLGFFTNGIAAGYFDASQNLDLNANINLLSQTDPAITWFDNANGTNGGVWDEDAKTGLFCLRTLTDAYGAGTSVLCSQRTSASTAVTSVQLGYGSTAVQIGGASAALTFGVASSTYSFPSTSAVAFSGALSAPSLSLTTALPATSGGTGLASYTTGQLIAASSGTALSGISDVAAGSYLRSAGTSTLPTWSTNTLPNTDALGDIWYASATNTITALAPNTSTTQEFLTQTGTGTVGAAPSWTSSIPASAVQSGTFAGSTAATFPAALTATKIIVSSSTAPTNGLYLPATNTIGLAANSTLVLESTTGLLTIPEIHTAIAPTTFLTSSALSSCGTTPAISATASDTKGTITEGTTATGCTLTFATAYATAPDCIVTSPSGVVPTSYTTSTTALTIVNASATGDKFTYHCYQ